MESIDKDIINRMQNPNEGCFFVNDFIDLGNHTEITEALKGLVDKQLLISINDYIYALARLFSFRMQEYRRIHCQSHD
jgi:hypothetical protein